MTLRSTSADVALIPLVTLGALALVAATSPADASTRTSTVKAVETELPVALSRKGVSV